MDTSEKLMPNNGQAVSQLEYSRMIGYLVYAMTCTRPETAFVVGKLSRYTSNPVLEGYTDASWINNTKDNSSTSGWVFLLSGGAISWASKKQICITGSTIKFEYVALAAAGKEAEWLKNLLLEIPLWSKPIAPISIFCDSDATLAKTYSQMYNRKSRHLGVSHSMTRELITNAVISIEFPAIYVEASVAASKLCYSLPNNLEPILCNILQPMWQPSQQPVTYVAASAKASSSVSAFTASCNLCSNLQPMWQPLATAYNLSGSLQSIWQPLQQPTSFVQPSQQHATLYSSVQPLLQTL
uniref:Zinc finger, CCHC-type n=1 Tax=Tanacetum cinerariifolium TaxID=118510 RepID=A0A699HYD6_TANCI|nr:zinc finger, CCHC-type [Tanacetum cinerariifolium]